MGDDGGEVKQSFWKSWLMFNSEGSAEGQAASSLKLRVSRLLLLGGLALILLSLFGLMIGAGSTLAGQLFNQSQPTGVVGVMNLMATNTAPPTATATGTPSNTIQPTPEDLPPASVLNEPLALMACLEVDGAVLREGPGTEYMAVSGGLGVGSMVEVLFVESSQNWLLVTTEDDLQGWLSIEWLSLDFDINVAAVLDVQTATPIPTRTQTPIPTNTPKAPQATATKPPPPATATKLPPPPATETKPPPATETKPPPATETKPPPATETKPPPATPTIPAYP